MTVKCSKNEPFWRKLVLLLVYFLLKEQGLTIENYNPDQINGYTV
jgi:hypothetical protein